MTFRSVLFLRYYLEYAMTVPGALFVIGVNRDHLRMSAVRTLLLAVLAALSVSWVGAWISTATEISSWLLMIPVLLVSYAAVCRVCSLSWSRIAFEFTMILMLGVWACLITGYFFIRTESLNPADPFTLRSGGACLLLFAAALLGFYLTFRNRIPAMFEMPLLDRMWNFMFLIPLFWGLFFWGMLPDFEQPDLGGHSLTVILLSSCMIVALLYTMLLVMWYFAIHLVEREQLRQENLLLKKEETRYQTLQSYMKTSRVQRHNFRQHLRVISRLAAENDMESLKKYISEFSETVVGEQTEFCANSAVDAIAAWYQNVADQQKTRIRWTLQIPESLPVRNNDLCMILGNLLENALRVTGELPEEKRVIEAKAMMIGGHMLGMVVSNPYKGIVQLGNNGLPVQSGREGIGLKSISDLVSTLHGSMMIETENGQFTVNILINLND